MASIWNRLKGGSPASSVNAPIQPARETPAPRFTSTQIDEMRVVVDALDLDIELYQNAEAIEEFLTKLWGQVNREQLLGLDERLIVAAIERVADLFHSTMRSLDTRLGRIHNKQLRLRENCQRDVIQALAEFESLCQAAQDEMDKLQMICNRLQLGNTGEGEKERDCWDQLQHLKDAIRSARQTAPGLWRPLYSDIDNLVDELKALLPK